MRMKVRESLTSPSFSRHGKTEQAPLCTSGLTKTFDKIIVGRPHNYHLRKHGGNIVAVWCNSDQFARAEGLHGLITGMIDSEGSVALLYRVETSQEERDC